MTTVYPNTLWSYIHADISVPDCHIPINELNAEVPMLIRPTILEIFAWDIWLDRVFEFTVKP